MKYYVVIPAHNEASFLKLTLDSLAAQTVLPTKVVVVDDHSSDATFSIASDFAQQHPWLSVIRAESHAVHLPGSKVIRAFEKGFATLDQNFDIIVKADADLIFPPSYFETILQHFASDERIGMAGGFAYIEKNGEWVLENLTDKDHIRGAFKAYRKACFDQIGGLRPAMGWDTVDELLCAFFGWKVVTDDSLHVRHLKPTGANYNQAARFKQGEAFYSLGYGFAITAIASAKLALMKGKPALYFDYMRGFLKAARARKPLLVTDEQAAFIRRYRWSRMKGKLGGKS